MSTNDYPEPDWDEPADEEVEEAIREWGKENSGTIETEGV